MTSVFWNGWNYLSWLFYGQLWCLWSVFVAYRVGLDFMKNRYFSGSVDYWVIKVWTYCNFYKVVARLNKDGSKNFSINNSCCVERQIRRSLYEFWTYRNLSLYFLQGKQYQNDSDMMHEIFMNQTFLRFSPACFERRKARDSLIYRKFVQIRVVLLLFSL